MFIRRDNRVANFISRATTKTSRFSRISRRDSIMRDAHSTVGGGKAVANRWRDFSIREQIFGPYRLVGNGTGGGASGVSGGGDTGRRSVGARRRKSRASNLGARSARLGSAISRDPSPEVSTRRRRFDGINRRNGNRSALGAGDTVQLRQSAASGPGRTVRLTRHAGRLRPYGARGCRTGAW